MSNRLYLLIAGTFGIAAGAIHLNADFDVWGMLLTGVGVLALTAGLFWKSLKALVDAR